MSEFDRAYGDTTARFYDAAYAAMSAQRRDRDFYLALAREAAGPVLELGCGTGRVLLDIAAAGFPCTGLDASRAMLDALRAKSPPRTLRLVNARMQDFDLGEDRFSLIFAGFRAFQHMHGVEDQLACLASVRRHLAPGGLFVFDVFRPILAGPDSTAEREQLRFRLGEDEVIRYESVERDRATQLLRVRMRYEVHRDGRVVDDLLTEFGMRWFHRYELEHLLARAGFELVAMYGDFERNPIGADTPDFIPVARRSG